MSDDGGANAESSEEDTTESSEEDISETSGGGESAESDPDDKYKLRLIKEVQKRRLLWNTRKHGNRPLKDAKWTEVVEKIHGKSWSTLAAEEKLYKEKRARNTWRNMKDCFRRCVKKVEKGERGRRYRYYKQLQFLEPIFKSSKRRALRPLKRDGCKDKAKKSTPGAFDCKETKRSSKCSCSELASNQVSSGVSSQPSNDLASCQKFAGPSTSTRDDALSNRSCNDPACQKVTTGATCVVQKYEPPGGSASETATRLPTAESGQQMRMTPFEVALLESLRTKREKEPDEDKDFASSLVPMLRELDYDKKFYAKKNILEVLKTAKYLTLDALVDLPGPAGNGNTFDLRHMDETSSFPSSTNAMATLPHDLDHDELMTSDDT